ncbi:hypothetical protein EYF80_004739 [Liparis tanakae]|uniref:Uncharacterized protein n=1 Tax=Liparis tanakae TaxID=230148 RepID=A0A4Z2J418_9TELE|nr:hypothetical protein EYF80_004739 [Liparis tanakae]
MQVEQQVPDDELPVVGRYEISGAGGQQRLHQAPPGPQRVALCTQTPTDTVALHHLLQDGVHLLEGHTQGHIGGNAPPGDGLHPAFTSATSTRCSNCRKVEQNTTHQRKIKDRLVEVYVLDMETHLHVAHGVSLLIDVLTVGDHLLDLSALKEVQLQQLRHILTEIDGVQHTQQLPAH